MDSPVYNCKHRSRLEDISTSSSLDRSDINMMDLFETQPARNINRNNNAAKKTETDSPHTSKSSIFTSASTSAQKPPETSGFFISAKSNSRIQGMIQIFFAKIGFQTETYSLRRVLF